MSELSKEELIETLKINKRNCSDSWDRGYNTAVRNAIDLAKNLPDTARKPVVQIIPKCADEFIKKTVALGYNPIYEACCYYDTYSDSGNGEPDFPKDFAEWFKYHKKDFFYAVVNGYEVEQPKRWVVENEHKFRLSEISGSAGASLKWTFDSKNKKFMVFEDFEWAKKVAYLITGNVAELIGGEVEET